MHAEGARLRQRSQTPMKVVNSIEKFRDAGCIYANVNSLQVERKVIGDLSGTFDAFGRHDRQHKVGIAA
jgi:hypothetical protein